MNVARMVLDSERVSFPRSTGRPSRARQTSPFSERPNRSASPAANRATARTDRTRIVRGEVRPPRPRRGARAMRGNLSAPGAGVKESLPLGAARLEVAPGAQHARLRRQVAALLRLERGAGQRLDRHLALRLPRVVDGERQAL